VTRTFLAPGTLEEAVAALRAEPEAIPVAGGTDLVVGVRSGKRELPSALVSLHLLDLGGLSVTDGRLVAGTLVTHAELEHSKIVRERWPALSDAAVLVGSPATRQVGTIGGNLVNGSPAMESGSPLLVYEAEVLLNGAARVVPIADFLIGPGRTALEPAELVTGVAVPAPPPGSGSAYVRLEYRRTMEIAVVGAAALVRLESGIVRDARIALTAVAPTCVRCPAAEHALVGAEPTAAALREAASLAGEAASPISDVRASERYRRAQIPVVVRRALETALRRSQS
jgi:CO/xanthine dehydrogenase FAD-binding subunit